MTVTPASPDKIFGNRQALLANGLVAVAVAVHARALVYLRRVVEDSRGKRAVRGGSAGSARRGSEAEPCGRDRAAVAGVARSDRVRGRTAELPF
jgi:hypothetical protein